MAQTHLADQQVVVREHRRGGSWLVVRIVYWILGLIEVILAFRFALKLLGANPNAPFADFVYAVSAPLIAPFEAVFGVNRVAGSTLEWSTLLAMAVYAVIAWGVVTLIEALTPRRDESVQSVEEVHENEQTPPMGPTA